MEWPTDVGFSQLWEDYAEEYVQSVYCDGGPVEHAPTLEPYDEGSGRVVYDISHVTTTPAVLKVAYNDYGADEAAAEIQYRSRAPAPLQERLVPIVNYGHGGAWAVQPKCSTNGDSSRAVDELEAIATEHDVPTAEIYGRNVGFWNGGAVILDYGGLTK